MKAEAKIGPMAFVPIRAIRKENHKSSVDVYKIHLPGGILAATHLHAFKVLRDDQQLCLPTHELRPGDKIWVDIVAFTADGSLRKD